MDEDTTKDESEYPKPAGNGTSSCDGYKVEARFSGNEPIELCGQIFDNRWRQVKFKESPVGVRPAPAYLLQEFMSRGLLCYSSAQALRWWLQSNADTSSPFGGICLDTKLIKHRLVTEFKCEAVSEHDLIGGENRSNCIPDWGKKE